MILSFSIPEMLPMIEAGIRQANGEDVGNARVKAQTIRKIRLGGRYWCMLQFPEECAGKERLHLWWKSRTPERRKLGVVTLKSIERVTIANIDGRSRIHVETRLVQTPPAFSYLDGFDTLDAFRDYFVPNPGDVFNGVLIKW